MHITNINQLDQNKLYTYTDYLLWKFQERVELIRGKIFRMSPAPSAQHQQIVSFLNFYFYKYLVDSDCKVYPAPFDVRLSKVSSEDESEIINVVQPDISIVCDPYKIDEKGCNGPPDLIVEVVSKGSVKKDLHEKYDLYQEARVREYWIVNPIDQTIQINILNEKGMFIPGRLLTNGDIAVSQVLSGFEIEINELFPHLLSEPEEPYGENVKRL